MPKSSKSYTFKDYLSTEIRLGIFKVQVQGCPWWLWVRIHLAMQGTWVRSLVRELGSPWCGATNKPTCCNSGPGGAVSIRAATEGPACCSGGPRLTQGSPVNKRMSEHKRRRAGICIWIPKFLPLTDCAFLSSQDSAKSRYSLRTASPQIEQM